MNLHFLKRTCVFCLSVFALASVAQAATITGGVLFTGGPYSSWTLNFASSNPNVSLDSVSITLPTNYFFDTASGGSGFSAIIVESSPSYADFQKALGTASVSGLTPSTAALRDGSNSLAIGFTGYDTAASIFTFFIDVDGTVGATNGLKALVDAHEIAGTTIAFNFISPTLNPITLTAMLSPVVPGNPIGVAASGRFDGTMVPEPSSYALMGSGLLTLLYAARRRRS